MYKVQDYIVPYNNAAHRERWYFARMLKTVACIISLRGEVYVRSHEN